VTLYGTPRPATHRPPRRPPWLALAAGVATFTLAASLGWIALAQHADRAHLDAGQATLARAWDLQIAQVDVPAALPEPGGPIGRLYLPRLGLNWILVEGVSEAALAAGPGHYPGSALPGGKGNFAVAGHREVGLWADLDVLAPDDVVIVQTRTRWYRYRIVSSRVMPPTVLDEVAPTPPGFAVGSRLMTLTTCSPRWSNTSRLIVRAVLDRSTPRDEVPKEITDGAEH
jgi:sortase A